MSVACNEDYCVTGDENKNLKVWPLEFSDVFMGVPLDGAVLPIDISPDGLRVACGTLYGSLGILDKSNMKYYTLIRSHSNKILSMDFHVLRRNIITVSLDSTIRLWDLKTND